MRNNNRFFVSRK